MKRKLFAISFALMTLSSPLSMFSQGAAVDSTTVTAEAPAPAPPVEDAVEEAATPIPDEGAHAIIKNKFIEGGVVWMTPVLLCLILGLAVAIERIISLFMASGNTNRFKDSIEAHLKNRDVEAAKAEARNTPGPIASIYYQGLDRHKEGLGVVEGSVASYGSVQVSKLESGLVWLGLFIALAPMLGFLGTVIGMIQAFDDIQAEGDISPTVVAGGIKVALLTTVAGLIVAIILQIFYNFITSKIDSMVGDMESSSIDLVDMMLKNEIVK